MDEITDRNALTFQDEPELPAETVETPCFVIYEDRVIRNLERSIAACGGAERFMPHVKTHRAPWIVRLLRQKGIEAFKAATPAEIEMIAAEGAGLATLAYTTVNPANIARLVRCASRFPRTRFVALVDSDLGADIWCRALEHGPENIGLRVDLDSGMGRTGAPMDATAIALARKLADHGRFAGWHLYDGHIHGSRGERRLKVEAEIRALGELDDGLAAHGLAADLVVGGSYTFDLWPGDVARYVSPGSWTFSSADHDVDLADLDWEPAAFVLSTVISRHGDTVTLDAGAKAISPDKPLKQRFRLDGEIVLMSEEHSVVRMTGLALGDRVLLLPRHACTTAYLYDHALVRTTDGAWEVREQLGPAR